MGDDILFDDSPIAKYIASVNGSFEHLSASFSCRCQSSLFPAPIALFLLTSLLIRLARPRRGKKIEAFKIEKVSDLQDEAPKIPTLDPSPATVNLSPSRFSKVFPLIGLDHSHLNLLKSDLVRNGAQKIAETFFLSNSPFSSLAADTVPLDASQVKEITSRISSIQVLLAIFAIGAGILGVLIAHFLSTLLVVFFWLALALLRSYVEAEEEYFQTCSDLSTELPLLSPKFEKYFTAVRSALQLVQEVELVSRGYRITAHLSPISRLEENAKGRRCQLLRRATFSSLSDVIALLRSMLLHPDLLNVPPEMSANGTMAPQDVDEARISVLKAMDHFAKIGLHTYAEELILQHFKLALDEKRLWRLKILPSLAELRKTRREILSLFATLNVQTESILSALAFQEAWVTPSNKSLGEDKKKEGENMTESDKLQKNLFEHLNALQSALQTQVAQTVLCKDLLLKYDSDPTASLDAIVKTFSALKSLDFSVTNSGESTSHALDRLLHRLQSGTESTLPSTEPMESKNFGDFESAAPTTDSATFGSFLQSIPKNASIKESVFEAETGAEEEEEIPRSVLSREERIHLAKQAREDARKKEQEVFARLNFVMELKDVLNSRVEERERAAATDESEVPAPDLQ